jgi:DNA modification methylase
LVKAAGWENRIVGHGEEAPDQLLANPKNWRVHPKAQQDALSGLLDSVGWVQNVIVNRRTGHVVDGHLRVSLAISREEPTIPVVYVDLAEDEEALVLASLDPLAAMAVTDEEMLAELLGGVVAEGALAEMLSGLMGKNEPKQGLTDPDDAPPLPVEPITKSGDLWLLGEHRLLCGDAANLDDVAHLMDGAKADILWTDPPYGVAYVGKTAEKLTMKNDVEFSLPSLLKNAFVNARSVMQPGAPFYVAHSGGGLHSLFWTTAQDAGWQIHQELVWVKDRFVLGHSDYHFRHEPILYGWMPGEGRSGRGSHEGTRWYGDHSQSTVFEIPRPSRSEEHPTMKPPALVAACLTTSSRAGDVVLELFAGSGSTVMAAEQLGRRCYAMEIDPRYADVTVRRWEDFTGKKAERV